MWKWIASLFLSSLLVCGAAGGQGINHPTHPQSSVTYPFIVESRVIQVRAGEDLQRALDLAQPGDTVVLEAGASWTGRFALKDKVDNGKWITVRSSRALELPFGQRVTPADSSKMARLIPPDNLQALDFYPTSNGFVKARKWLFIGVEIQPNPNYQPSSLLIKLGTNGSWQTSTEQAPEDIIFDRCYLHGLDNVDAFRAVSICGTRIALLNCNISNFHVRGGESQAILIANAPGTILIENNEVEGATENLMSGGLDVRIPNLTPSDITVRRNHFFKPLGWIGKGFGIKNLFELKNARRVLIEQNVFENNWVDGQSGLSILFTPRNQTGGNPWTVVEDITFRNNLILNVAGGFGLIGHDNNFPSQQTQRIEITGNTILGLGNPQLGFNGRILQLLDDSKDVIFTNNSIEGLTSAPVVFAGLPTLNLIFTDNIFPRGEGGVRGDNRSEGTDSLNFYAPNSIFIRNVLLNGAPYQALYPTRNYFTN